MKEILVRIVKGFFFGIANIIPGVSGGTLAMTLGVYEELIQAISHFFRDFKKNLQFLVPFLGGAVLSILLMSKLISWCLENYPFPTTLFFVGLILGGIPLIAKKVRGNKIRPIQIILFCLTFGLIMLMTFSFPRETAIDLADPTLVMYLLLFLVGVIAAATMVIPGISGSFVLMLLGFYQPIVDTVSSLTRFSQLGHNLAILVPFGIGIIVGIVLVAKLIEWLFHKFEQETYYAILGFVIASVVALVVTLFGSTLTFGQILVGLLAFGVAITVGYRLGDE